MFADKDTNHGQRFAEKSAQATVGYANAGYFAGLFAVTALFEAWTDACLEATQTPKSNSKSWFRDPAKLDVFDPWIFWSQATPSLAGPPSGQNWMTQPWFPACWMPFNAPVSNAWLEILPSAFNTTDLSFTRSPFWATQAAALPMTWSLMSFGLPHAVAKPTAEANTAALEALDSAQQVANDHMTAYQNALEPTSKKTIGDKAFDPFDACAKMFWPWLDDSPTSEAPAAA